MECSISYGSKRIGILCFDQKTVNVKDVKEERHKLLLQNILNAFLKKGILKPALCKNMKEETIRYGDPRFIIELDIRLATLGYDVDWEKARVGKATSTKKR